jgi:alanine-glyoxylate transaminase/serine-glyoxylate transaminase/serine-pyruvate transaminase
VRVDEVGIDIAYSGAQKCLSATPGASPITFGPRAVSKMEARKTQVPNWYLDMSLLMNYWGESPKGYHHTAPISAFYGLYESLRIAAEEGLENRWARHRQNAEMLWAGMEDIGLSMHVPLENRIPSLTTVQIPEGVDDLGIRKALLSDYNIEISGGFAELAGKVWRIGLMGYSSRPENVLLLLAALEKLL